MKYVFLFFLLVIFSFNSNGQILERSRENSYNVNVYKLESKNAQKFFDLNYGYHFPSRFLKSKVDSFPSDSASYYKSLLPAGNYILVQADFHRNNAGVSAEYFLLAKQKLKYLITIETYLFTYLKGAQIKSSMTPSWASIEPRCLSIH